MNQTVKHSRGVSGRVHDMSRRMSARMFPFGPGVSLADGLARRVDNFLLLRVVAASLVIYGHAAAVAPAVSGPDIFVRAGWGVYSGEIAVNVFFLISGFLVTGSFIRQQSLLRFLKLRLLRVYPAYLLNLLVLVLPLGLLLTELPTGDYLRHPGTLDYVVRNLPLQSDMTWTLPGVFTDNPKTATVNGSQWTLPAELRMYVLLGILGALGLLNSARTATVLAGALLVAGLWAPQYFPLHADWFRLAGYFALGVLAFVHRKKLVIRGEVVLALVMLCMVTRHLGIYPQVLAVTLAAAVFWIVYVLPPLHVIERFGDPSYGIYLWGWPSQQVIAHWLPGASTALHVGLALVLAVTAGYLSWHLVEKHALRLK